MKNRRPGLRRVALNPPLIVSPANCFSRPCLLLIACRILLLLLLLMSLLMLLLMSLLSAIYSGTGSQPMDKQGYLMYISSGLAKLAVIWVFSFRYEVFYYRCGLFVPV
jgi:hypothetical protein